MVSLPVAVTPLVALLPRFVRFDVPEHGCTRVKTSVTADFRNCVFATNGGFFSLDTGACVGNVLVNGSDINLSDAAGANFAFNGTHLVTGYVSRADFSGHRFHFRDALQGAGWLVRRSQPHVNVSVARGEVSPAFASEMAPRTAIGHLANGTVLLVVVDGEEDIKAGSDVRRVFSLNFFVQP